MIPLEELAIEIKANVEDILAKEHAMEEFGKTRIIVVIDNSGVKTRITEPAERPTKERSRKPQNEQIKVIKKFLSHNLALKELAILLVRITEILKTLHFNQMSEFEQKFVGKMVVNVIKQLDYRFQIGGPK
jgi:hypothetical protein